jgi:hypothetical protein
MLCQLWCSVKHTRYLADQVLAKKGSSQRIAHAMSVPPLHSNIELHVLPDPYTTSCVALGSEATAIVMVAMVAM